MPYLDEPSDAMNASIARVAEKLLHAAKGEDGSVTAMAALRLAMAVWAAGGATQEQAKHVCNRAAEACIGLKEN